MSNNIKAYIDDLIKVLETDNQRYRIENYSSNGQQVYKFIFTPQDPFYISNPTKDEIRNFADDIQFGLQGKTQFPNILVEGKNTLLSSDKLLKSLLEKIGNKEHRERLFDIFFHERNAATLLKHFSLSSFPEKETAQMIGYILHTITINEDRIKDLFEFTDIVVMLRKNTNYDYFDYKAQFLSFLKSYKGLIDKNYSDNETTLLVDPRAQIADFIKQVELPVNYSQYKEFFPIITQLNKPPEKPFSKSKFRVCNFELSYSSFLQDDLIVTNKKDIENILDTIVSGINLYFKNHKFEGIQEIGCFKSNNLNNYNTNMWFKISSEIVNTEEVIDKGQNLLLDLIHYHKVLTLQNDPNMNIGLQIDKSIQKFALEHSLPTKTESNKNKNKL